jgi:hypothetical protein
MNLIEYFRLISYVSLVDASLIIGIYLIVGFIFNDLFWINKIKSKFSSLFVILSLLVAVWIEYRGVYLLQKWSYSSLMPVVFGIGLSPLMQLAITGLISLFIVKRINFA